LGGSFAGDLVAFVEAGPAEHDHGTGVFDLAAALDRAEGEDRSAAVSDEIEVMGWMAP
jgi:hypothetical protein